MPRRSLLLALGIVALLAIAGAAWWVFQPAADTSPAIRSAAGYELKAEDRTMGDPKAKVVLIEYAAVTCPACAMFNAQIFPRIKSNYIDTGKMLYVFRMFPRMAEDGAGEKMARCVPPDKYFTVIDALFNNQPKWNPEFGVQDSHGGLLQVGRIVGMSAEQVDQCIAAKEDDDRINAVATEGQSRYNVTGTPTFVINGQAQPSGGMSYEAMAGLLDQALAGK
jgi:protein-disulfide isomerase